MIVSLGLIAHLIGDFVLQSHVMAVRKTSSWTWACVHATFYTLPFSALLVATCDAGRSFVALLVIGVTHAIIDRLALGARWARWYGNGHPGIWHRAGDIAPTVERWFTRPGLHHLIAPNPAFKPPPEYLGTWLTIIVDNTFHLVINTAALLWAAWGTTWI